MPSNLNMNTPLANLDTEEARTTADTALRDYHLGLMTFAFLHYLIVVSNRIYTRFRITNMP